MGQVLVSNGECMFLEELDGTSFITHQSLDSKG